MMKFCPQKQIQQYPIASSDGRHRNEMHTLVEHNSKREQAFIALVIVLLERKLVKMSNHQSLPSEMLVVNT